MTVGIYPLRPESSGSIHIRSADPQMPPAIRPRFLDTAADRATLLAGMRIARRIVEGQPLDEYREFETSPGPDVQTDDELLAYARAKGDTSYHPVGTCRMGSGPAAVVDERLRVLGVHGLRVIDASIMPMMISGNTNATSMMIGEKGAALVLEDHSQGTAP
jgi:choline dehydrogenase-like flavoprotein